MFCYLASYCMLAHLLCYYSCNGIRHEQTNLISEMAMETMHSWKQILIQRAFELDLQKQASMWNHSTSSEWPNLFPESCSGKRQSPININTGHVLNAPVVDVVHLVNYDKPLHTRIQLDEHHLRLRTDSDVSITGYDLISNLLWIDWHFSSHNDQGSEHSIDGRHFPIEVQFFHKNIDKFSSGPVANLTAITCLFEMSSENNAGLEKVLHQLELYLKHNTTIISDAFRFQLDTLLPKQKAFIDQYYMYSGSITWPPCTQNVRWIVLKEYCTVSQSQLVKLRTLVQNRSINFNRPTQILNGRVIKNSHGLSPAKIENAIKKISRRKPKMWHTRSEAATLQNSSLLNTRSSSQVYLLVTFLFAYIYL